MLIIQAINIPKVSVIGNIFMKYHADMVFLSGRKQEVDTDLPEEACIGIQASPYG